MKVIKATRSVFFDVDDTLVIWDYKALNVDEKSLISITDPVSKVTCKAFPHLRHVELMQQFKARGHLVVVWSAGGAEWAAEVCKTLGIENLVDMVMDKPNWYVDDLNSSTWMKAPIFLDPLDPKKDSRWGIPNDNK